MKVPISWLEEYVPITVPLEDLAHRLTMAGTEVDSIESTGSYEGVVVGLAKEVGPHPDADRLRLVQVDNGTKTLEVVCGAPNVATGQKIAFASIGAVLTDAHTGEERKLRKSKIRGVTSNGMVCSERELGMSDEHEGILVLPEDAPVGTPLGDYLGETILDLELTPNRPDCLAVMGVAREVAALTGETATPPSLDYPEDGPDISTLAKVEIEDPDLCRRYTATLIQGVTIGPSPDWLADRLRAIGERPINNVVDVTNYVMFELGQPLHSFDFDELSEGRVVVRRARLGETLLTLDGETRELTTDNLMIADAGRPIGLGGIIGGTESGITDGTKSVLLEAANFDGSNNRRTASGFGVRTEATLRFEKGLRPELAEYGVRRATKLILELAGGTVASGMIDEWPDHGGAVQPVELPVSGIERLLGVSYESELVLSTLERLGMEVVSGNGTYTVTPPYWRPDITIPEDLIEELARIIGYEMIPTLGITGSVPAWEPSPERDLRERIKDILADYGMQETISYSLTTPEAEARARPPEHGLEQLRVMNPLSAEQATLRTTLRHSILAVLSRNARTWRGPLRMFESGRVYLDKGEGVGLPNEPEKFVGVVAGPRSDLEWMSAEPESSDFYDAKGIIEALLGEFGVTAGFAPAEETTFEPGRCARIVIPSAGRAEIGVLGEVASEVLATFDIETAPVAMFELDVEAISKLPELQKLGQQDYTPFGRFPDSARDLALLIDDTVPAADVLALVERNRLAISATVFDVYQGDAIPAGKKSLAVRVVYQANDRTLTTEDLTKAENSILRALEHNLGAELRTQ
ncbi:MAG: phenylalanine--tRNA ligase subunit beta [Chloroflexi bacterium]|jgi:phenylalanyl-tRNA synthetase beta chain|nr:phenylalanine--tRNA ligase subunit beta [Chloroflexota bacterium]MBT4072522.1 phenylalanine--tRNA ligase subunit beta [Chloroflexota bacterium]MBT6680607.1 phenylalanine--tRNA ligase subunit beta [Chloroflexota bacterium]